MRITCKFITTPKVVVMKLTSRLTLAGGFYMEFREKIDECLSQGHTNFVIAMQELLYIDSTGVCEILSALTRISDAGGRMVICGPSTAIRNLLAITKLQTAFNIVGSEEEALSRFY
jgi:anti-sigma B factor antagonist